MKLDDQVYLLGIRHHGPGCAHALTQALREIEPDLILLEGAAELEQCWQLASHPDMKPPVAQLIYDPKQPHQSTFYPWGEFSPEWQAMIFAQKNNIALQMMDLPAGIEFELRQQEEERLAALEEKQEELEAEDEIEDDEDQDNNHSEEEGPIAVSSLQDFLRTPLDRVVHAAGYEDGETWWDITIEHQRSGLEIFSAIAELMVHSRQAEEQRTAGQDQSAFHQQQAQLQRDQLREAWMRKCLRLARKNHQKIAVVCGAWHVPALANPPKVKDDNDKLKGLKKRKVDVAWVPYTYQRFSFASGYGAGIESPGWYEHLHKHHQQNSSVEELCIAWMIRIAHLLRKEGFGCSSAHVIEAVKLARDLASLRQLTIPSLAEMLDAAKAVMTEGNSQPLDVIRQQLVVSNRLGSLPEDVPQLPLEKDLNDKIKTLRLKKQADSQHLVLDLRKDSGLARSQLLHRLNLIEVPWGRNYGSSGTGTFKEEWVLEWKPEFAVALIDASTLGNTVEAAASQKMIQHVQETDSVSQLAQALDAIQLSDLNAALEPAIIRLKSLAAVSGDIQDLMESLLTLVQVARYGSVRNRPNDNGIEPIIHSIIIRVCNGLAPACINLDEDAAYAMLNALDKCHSAITMLENEEHQERWQQALFAVVDNRSCHPVLLGRCNRILYDLEQQDAEQLNNQFRLELSEGNDVTHGAAWLEGLFINGAVLLLYDDKLFELLDTWINQLEEEDFVRVLPMVRRSFSTFSPGELNQLSGRVLYGSNKSSATAFQTDPELAQLALQKLAFYIGLNP